VVGLIYTEDGKTAAKVNMRSMNSVIFKAGFEVLIAVVMKSSIFCDITPCSPIKVNRRFGEHIASIIRVKEFSQLISHKIEIFS
jgi:hypothetical protein